MSKFNRKKSLLPLVMAIRILSVLFLTSGCDILLPAPPLPATATATQTMTSTPTIDWFPATATSTQIPMFSPTPQPTLDDPREGVTEMLVEDDFTDQVMWTTPQTGSGNIVFGTGNLTLAVANPKATLFSLSQHDLNRNFYLEITVETSLCQPMDEFGIVFWRQSLGDHYQIVFTCTGQYKLEVVQGGQSVVIHDWETATQMQPSHPATNRVGLWVYEGQLQLFVNDVFQFEERIAQDRTGSLGVFAKTVEGNAMTIRFSDLQIFRVDPD
ncbi:MAG: hypothetical protein SVT56_01350 [Chloroflexota bacterium]|nr:hypothetical protein [Chloroflexota bacterium]